MEQRAPDNLSPYRTFSRAAWAALREDMPMTLTSDEVMRLRPAKRLQPRENYLSSEREPGGARFLLPEPTSARASRLSDHPRRHAPEILHNGRLQWIVDQYLCIDEG